MNAHNIEGVLLIMSDLLQLAIKRARMARNIGEPFQAPEIIEPTSSLSEPSEIDGVDCQIDGPEFGGEVDAAIEVRDRRIKELEKQVAELKLEGPLITIRAIQRAVCTEFEVSFADLIGPRRHGSIIPSRQAAMWLACEYTYPRLSLPEIGRRFGDRDHTTILHAKRAFPRKRQADPKLDAIVSRIETAICAAGSRQAMSDDAPTEQPPA